MIFLNLVGNGIKFILEGGDIYIIVLELLDLEYGVNLELKVKDNGMGILVD